MPRVAATETYTDNVGQATTAAVSDFITELTAAVRIDANASRLRANVDYGLTEVYHARDTASRRTLHSLGGSGSLEAVDDFAFVDFAANISQQRVSAFGPQAQGNFNSNGNTAETSTYSVSPHVRGRLGSLAEYRIRYAASEQSAAAGQGSDVFNDQWSASLSGDTPSERFLWALNGTTQRSRYGDQPDSESASANGRLTYIADIEYRAWVSAGRERNDFGTLGQNSFSTRGVGVDWTPGPRTSVSVSRLHRFFGDSNSLTINHRMSRALFSYSQSEDVSVIPNQLGAARVGSLFDVAFAQLESTIPDPVLRAAEANRRIALLNRSPNDPVFNLFLARRISVQKQRVLNAVFQGARNVLAISGSRTENRSLVDGIFGDDFDSTDVIRTNAVSLSLTHQISPDSSLSAAVSRAKSEGANAAALSSTTRTASLGFNTRLGHATSLSAGLSRAESEGASSAYTANNATVSISHTF